MTGGERALVLSACRRLTRTRDIPTIAGVIVQHELAAGELRKLLRPPGRKNITRERRQP